MQIKKSDLILEDFKVLSCSFAAVPTEKKVTQEQLRKQFVDLDFEVLFN